MAIHRSKKLGVVTLLATVLVLGLSVITPSVLLPHRSVDDPRTVLLIDHGTHSSLVIETSAGEMVRYAYGDMRYYAERDTSLASGAAALFVPTQATLGRAELQGPALSSALLSQLNVGIERIHELKVQGESADRLMEDLDRVFWAGADQHKNVGAYGLVFAPHPDPYFWGNNSSTMVADWLRALGVTVLGWGLLASWYVVH